MSNEMVERVARALFDVDLGCGDGSMQWSKSDLEDRGYIRKARAAIEAMMVLGAGSKCTT